MTLQQIKAVLTLISILSAVGGIGYVANKWHYAPIKHLEETNGILKKDLIEQSSLLGVCETKLHKVNLDGFIEGIGENNETISIDFDDLNY
tara:strand:+ start:1179 stop:1451 length:273 start_codon:yes stop_codon:yes gene_type:complete